MVKMDNENIPKNAVKCPIYYCDICDFKCCKYSNFKTHKTTLKHLKNENDNKMVKNGNELTPKMPKNSLFSCSCGKCL
jgi:excinuclease UvrABC nuclease subunit